MTVVPERLYTLRQLVRISGLSYDFWDQQCRTHRLAYLQPAGPGGTRFVPESAYRRWVDACRASTGGPEEGSTLWSPGRDTDFTFKP